MELYIFIYALLQFWMWEVCDSMKILLGFFRLCIWMVPPQRKCQNLMYCLHPSCQVLLGTSSGIVSRLVWRKRTLLSSCSQFLPSSKWFLVLPQIWSVASLHNSLITADLTSKSEFSLLIFLAVPKICCLVREAKKKIRTLLLSTDFLKTWGFLQNFSYVDKTCIWKSWMLFL